MKKTISLIACLLAGCLLLLASNANRAKYRHVRTNKKAWVREATSDNDSISMGLEIYISEDSVLITSEEPLFNIDITITDYLHDDAEMFHQHYPDMQPEERISIIDMPDGIYIITLRDLATGGFLFGYFAKGEQYEKEAEALGIPTIVAPRNPDEVYDLSGRKVRRMGKGIYIIDRKKMMNQ